MAAQRIDDHSFWAGRPGKDDVFPDGPHKVKSEFSADGDGHLSKYEDTTEAIRSQQEMSAKKSKAHSQRPGYRY